MTKGRVVELILKAAEATWRTEFVVIGSQAIHGTLADPAMDVIVRSNDLDIYPADGYDDANVVYQRLMEELGQDSAFDESTGTYIR